MREHLQWQLELLQQDLKRTYPENFMPMKKALLDYAFAHAQIDRVAELGCVWGIDCAYGLYVLDKYKPSKVVMVDTHWTDTALAKCKPHSQITTIQNNFGQQELPEQIGKVDAIILFDVLLHQVAPDWDRILQMYADYTDLFLIVNPQFKASPITVRLLDLGKEEYFKNVPHDPEHPTYQALFSKMYELHPDHQRIWRDVHHIWQWGITNRDLSETMRQLGYETIYLQSHGLMTGLPNFEHYAFAFRKNG
jgi:hypothetical protein